LPYGVKIAMPGLWDSKITIEPLNEIFKGEDDLFRVNGNGHCIEYIKPYLFPLSSMTEEQKEEHKDLLDNQYSFDANGNIFTLQDFYCKYHLDFRGLIPMGLAIDATGKNIY
jgi:hypothetical protein